MDDCLAPPSAPPGAAEAPPTGACLFLSARTAAPPNAAMATAVGGAGQYADEEVMHRFVRGAYRRVGGAYRRVGVGDCLVGGACPQSQLGSKRGGRGHSDPELLPAGPPP